MTLFLDSRPLLDAYRQGERHAFAAVYERYVSEVVTVLRHGFSFESHGKRGRFRGFSDLLELESFTQDVFLRAFSERARLGYDGLRPFAPYLLQIARNLVIDELRRRRSALERAVGPLEDDGDVDEATAVNDTSMDDQIDLERARRLVAEYVATCSDPEKSYIEARFVQENTQLAAARSLSISRMRARVLERKILNGLQRHLKSRGYLEELRALAVMALGVI